MVQGRKQTRTTEPLNIPIRFACVTRIQKKKLKSNYSQIQMLKYYQAYFYLSISTYLHSFLCSSFEDSFWYLLYLKKYNNKKKTKGWWNQNYPSVLVFMINQLKVCRAKHQRKQQQSTEKRSNCNLQYFVVVFEMLWILLKERGFRNVEIKILCST